MAEADSIFTKLANWYDLYHCFFLSDTEPQILQGD